MTLLFITYVFTVQDTYVWKSAIKKDRHDNFHKIGFMRSYVIRSVILMSFLIYEDENIDF